MDHSKHLKTLAHSGIAHVEVCECGMVYLGVGPVTVKLSREAFDQLAQGVAQADRALNRPAVETRSVETANVLAFGPRLSP